MTASEEHDRSVLVRGERINLCAVRREDLPEWASWFNSPWVTRYLEQGMFPNSEFDQEDFIRTARASGRFVAMVRSTSTDALLGTVSLSEINHYRQSAQVAIVMPNKCPDAPFAALEAMARVAEHGFGRLRLQRIWAGQAYPAFRRWNISLELLGYKGEGIGRTAFVHGRTVSNSLSYSLIASDFELLTERRGGVLWPGTELAGQIVEQMTGSGYRSIAERLAEFIEQAHREADTHLGLIETQASHPRDVR